MEQTSIVVKAILSAIPSIFYVKGIDGKYIVVSQAFKDNIKIAPDFTILGKEDKDLFPKDDAKKNSEEDLKVIRTGIPVTDTEDYIIGSRRRKWGAISKTPIFENKKIVGVLGNIVDITEKKAGEIIQKLISESIDNLDVSLSVYDINKKIAIYTNKECRKIFGIKEEVLDDDIGKHWLENIVHPEDREEQEKYVASMASGEKRPNYRTYRIIHPKKGLRTIKVFATDIIGFLDKKYIATLAIDITKSKNESKK